MPTDSIQVIQSPSVAKLMGFFVDIPQRVTPYLEHLMELSLEAIKAEISPYPPETEANSPGRVDEKGRPKGYYERGKGSWRPILRHPTLAAHVKVKNLGRSLGRGVITNTKIADVVGYVLRPTSQQLGKNWTTLVVAVVDGVEGVLSNPTSYAEPVQGPEGVRAQLPKSRGWTGIDEAIERAMPTILEMADEALNEFIAKEFPEG